MRTTHKIVIWFYINRRAGNLFLHTYVFVSLRNGYPLRCSLGSPSHEGIMFLSIREVLEADNFKFPVFLLKGEDAESIVRVRGPRSGAAQC